MINWKSLPLWPHQTAALNVIADYLAAEADGSALVRLPTGAGKSGIIATVGQLFPSIRDALVVAPWAHLAQQLQRHLESHFWRQIGVDPSNIKKRVTVFTPSNADEVLSTRDPLVGICTNQTLQRLHAGSPESYNRIKRRMAIVLVDEGHREPAPAWAKSVRELGKPCVLFTATPYRNDFRLFDVNQAHTSHMPFHEAVQGRFIRDVEFAERKLPTDAAAFALYLRRFHRQQIRDGALERDVRVIIRCATSAEVHDVAQALRALGEQVVAVHERFDNSGEFEFKDVPDSRTSDAIFWVHQYKLIEGLDDTRFGLLAIFQPFSNARMLVQQVGRVLRNPARQPGQRAVVLCDGTHNQKHLWDAYLGFEQQAGTDALARGPADLLHDYLSEHASYSYIGGIFRQRYDPGNPSFHEHLSYPLNALVFRPRASFDWNHCLHALQLHANGEDFAMTNSATPDRHTCVVSYVRAVQSPVLLDEAFVEPRLGFLIMRRSNGFVTLFDTEGVTPEFVSEQLESIDAEELERVLSGQATRVSQLSLLNTDLGAYSVRRRTLTARAIEALAPSLADHLHFCSTATGSVADGGMPARRYVGFTRSRVSEPRSVGVRFADYIAWVDRITATLADTGREGPDVFGRYALPTKPPADTTAEHILLDWEDVLDETGRLRAAPHHGGAITVDDSASDVVNGDFSVTVNGTALDASVSYDPKRLRYEVQSLALNNLLRFRDPASSRSIGLLTEMNRLQAFRIITTTGLVYAHGRFYKPRIPLWGRRLRDRLELLRVLYPLPSVAALNSEKGAAGSATANGWATGSVFEFVDRAGPTGLMAAMGCNPDVVVCDDLGNELADFIVLRFSPPLVAFVHGKVASNGNPLSASAFHDVCSQAVKNLAPLTPQWDVHPKDPTVWNRRWNGGNIGVVRDRIRRRPAGYTAASIWDRLRDLVRDPSTERQVWLVVGQGLSKAAFEAQLAKVRPAGYAIQMVYLLQGTWSAISSTGATLKIICRP